MEKHLLFEIKKLLPKIKMVGIDRSKHGLKNAPTEIKPNLIQYDINKGLPFKKNSCDLVITLACLHNLEINKLMKILKQIQIISKKKIYNG